MGIKSIKAVTNNFHTDPLFQFQSMVTTNRVEPVTKHYRFVKKIGAGTYGEVFKAENIHTDQPRAIKKINTFKHARAKTLVFSEIALLKGLDHPSILRVYEVFQQTQFTYIVTEFCEGKELFDVILEKKYFYEEDAAFLFYDILAAVRCMHVSHVMHRDIKPENIIYDAKNKTMKVIDFGSGVKFQDSDMINRKRVGTSYYIAPEVLARKYNEKCDVWSLGVLLYILLSGEPPFAGNDDYKVMEAIEKGEPLRFRKNIWKVISAKAKRLIEKMLQRDVKKRPNVAQVMENQWFQEFLFKRKLNQSEQRTMSYHLKNMKKYKDLQASPLQEGMLIFIVNFVKDKSDMVEMEKTFKELDLNKDGVVSLDELKIGLKNYLNVETDQALAIAKQIFKKVDFNRSGAIDFSEFVMSATSIEIVVDENNLDIAFDYIDADKSGLLSVQEIREKLGTNISEEMYQSLLLEFDVNGDGQISKQQFKVMMKALVKKKKNKK